MNILYYLKLKYYNNIFHLLHKKLIGKLIKKGKKIYAWKNYLELRILLKKKTKKDINLILLIALLNSLMKIKFIKKRFGSIKKDIPIILRFEKSINDALSLWLKNVIKKRGGINLKKLVLLICASYKFRGPIISQNYQLYKKAIVNRVLLNFIKK